MKLYGIYAYIFLVLVAIVPAIFVYASINHYETTITENKEKAEDARKFADYCVMVEKRDINTCQYIYNRGLVDDTTYVSAMK